MVEMLKIFSKIISKYILKVHLTMILEIVSTISNI